MASRSRRGHADARVVQESAVSVRTVSKLYTTQRTALVDAILLLKTQGKYDKYAYADQHDTYFGNAHGNTAFYPWHRKFLSNLETELQEIDPDIALPYWDSTQGM